MEHNNGGGWKDDVPLQMGDFKLQIVNSQGGIWKGTVAPGVIEYVSMLNFMGVFTPNHNTKVSYVRYAL